MTEINSDRTEDGQSKFEKEDPITVSSSYFEVRVDVELGEIKLPQTSLLFRNTDGIVTVLQRVRGDNLLQSDGVPDDDSL